MLRRQDTLRELPLAGLQDTSSTVKYSPSWTPYAGGRTDPGAGKENQDTFFTYRSLGGDVFVACVLDGHGREYGSLAAATARDYLHRECCSPTFKARLRQDAKGTLEAAFLGANAALGEAFMRVGSGSGGPDGGGGGWRVRKTEGGYYVRSRPDRHGEYCIHGGTTATLVVILEGRWVITAHVGDSTALLLSFQQQQAAAAGGGGVLREGKDWVPLPVCGGDIGEGELRGVEGSSSAAATTATITTTTSASSSTSSSSSSSSSASCSGFASALSAAPTPLPPPTFLELAADHSPESPQEWARIRSFRCDPYNPTTPELLFVYDSLSSHKGDCSPIFPTSPSASASANASSLYAPIDALEQHYSSSSAVGSGGGVGGGEGNGGQPFSAAHHHQQQHQPLPTPSDKGAYYKNVRQEWASLVTTPPTATYVDALAFTRSLGDFHLQSYGVSPIPQVLWVDLQQQQGDEQCHPPLPMALVVASDGVWDSFTFQDFAALAMDAKEGGALGMVAASGGEVEGALDVLMGESLRRGGVNFGDTLDNLTLIMVYLLPPSKGGGAVEEGGV